MGRLGSGVRRGAVALLIALLAACTALYQNHGYVPRDADLEQVAVGKSTREDVAKTVGRPSSTGLLTGGAWYYVGSRFRHYGPREPQEIDRQVVAISFDESGTVENVERFGLEKGQVVVLSRRVTDSNIKGLGFLRQLLGNIGNVSAGQIFTND
ncbi:outer membrane protein assembly factor BamE [Albidovulum sp.]|uniref:outer membrane protein assembly factor BamE n=1 Tax=Albidovulum sp. TaxID=1872424 RepID=UPI0039B851EB